MSYGSLLSQAANAAPPSGAPEPVANPIAPGVGKGPPPTFMGALPAPTNVGAMPTGTPGTSSKQACDEAVVKLRTVQSYYPSLGPQIEGMIGAIKAAHTGKPAGPSAAPLGSAQPPGAPPPPVSPTSLSGGPGPT